MHKIIRPGNTEIVCLYLRYLSSNNVDIDAINYKNWMDWLYRTSGYFDSDRNLFSFGPTLDIFLSKYLTSLKDSIIVLMPISLNAMNQIDTNHVSKFLDSLHATKIIQSGTFDYNLFKSQTNGGSILIVSPFAPLMLNQFECGNMSYIHPNFNPSKLKCFRFPYLFEGHVDYKNSLDAYDDLSVKIFNLLDSVDSVILSCGCYGALLAHFCHGYGKNVYYPGGDLQIFFGIMGKRWRTWLENDERYNSTKNFWINEVPEDYIFYNRKKIEKSSYW